VIVGLQKENPVTGKLVDAIHAQLAMKPVSYVIIKPKFVKNTEVNGGNHENLQRFWKCSSPKECLHQMLRNVIDGALLSPRKQKKSEVAFEFTEGDVFSLDILVSSRKDQEWRSAFTVSKKGLPENNYQLKMSTLELSCLKSLNLETRWHLVLRSLSDEKKARLGILE
jgi:hypothetical protein